MLTVVINLIFQLFRSGNLQSYKPEKFFWSIPKFSVIQKIMYAHLSEARTHITSARKLPAPWSLFMYLSSSLTCKFLSKGLRANLYIPTEPSTQCLPMFSGVLICLKETHICYLQQLVGARQLSRLWLGISGSWVLMRTVKLSDSSTGLGDLLPASSHDCCRKSQPQAKALTTLPEWVMMEKEGRNKVREGKK